MRSSGGVELDGGFDHVGTRPERRVDVVEGDDVRDERVEEPVREASERIDPGLEVGDV